MGVFEAAYPRVERAVRWCFGAGWSGVQAVGLGVLDLDEVMHRAVKRFGVPTYSDAAYVANSGLWKWEQEAIGRHFPASGRLLVGAAGAGREMVALTRAGYAVEGFECCRPLVDAGQAILRAAGCKGHLVLAEAGRVADIAGPFDGAIMGWSGYMYIPGREKRIALLRGFRAVLRPGAPLLVSFQTREGCERRMQWSARGANWIRTVRRAAPVEVGDRLDNGFKHWFDQGDLESEMREAGLEFEQYSSQWYGWSVGRRG